MHWHAERDVHGDRGVTCSRSVLQSVADSDRRDYPKHAGSVRWAMHCVIKGDRSCSHTAGQLADEAMVFRFTNHHDESGCDVCPQRPAPLRRCQPACPTAQSSGDSRSCVRGSSTHALRSHRHPLHQRCRCAPVPQRAPGRCAHNFRCALAAPSVQSFGFEASPLAR